MVEYDYKDPACMCPILIILVAILEKLSYTSSLSHTTYFTRALSQPLMLLVLRSNTYSIEHQGSFRF